MGRPRHSPQVETLVAIESGFWTAPDGQEYTFRAGETLVAADHPLVTQGNPSWFKPVEPHLRRPSVEQTTANPGEERGEREVVDRVAL
jgi:hypothetical protein